MSLPLACPLCHVKLDYHDEGVADCHVCKIHFTASPCDLSYEFPKGFVGNLAETLLLGDTIVELVDGYNSVVKEYLMALTKVSYYAIGSPVSLEAAKGVVESEWKMIRDIQVRFIDGSSNDVDTSSKEPFQFVLNLIAASHEKLGEHIQKLIDTSRKVDKAESN